MEEDKKIERFTKDILNEVGLEKPSLSFVENVMGVVEKPLVVNSTIYKPLISKKAWLLIAVCFIGIMTYAYRLPLKTSLFDKMVLNLNTEINFNFLQGISFSRPVIYALSVFGILVFAQIYLLKNNFEKQLNAM